MEEVRRTGKGDYATQFSMAAWERLAGKDGWTIPGFGDWQRASRRPFRQRSSLVLTRIPSTLSEEAMRQELATGAATRWPALPAEELQDISVVRLNRRVNGSNQSLSSANGGSHWVPSTSVRLFATKALCEAILNEGGTVLGSAFHEARHFKLATWRCMRCGQMGIHSAKLLLQHPAMQALRPFS